MHVLITGATGFVGSRLVGRLCAAGHTVSVVSRNPDRAATQLPLAASHHAWAPTAGLPPAAALEGVEAVVHLAGESVVGRWTAAKKRAIHDSRVLGTQHLVAALANMPQPPKVLISASAIGYYGDRGDAELHEDSSAGNDFLAEVCQGWEAAAATAESFCERVVRLRIGLVLDPDGGALHAMLRPFRLGLGGPLGGGRQWWSWIHLHDLLGLIEASLVDARLTGALNATSPNPSRQADFAQSLGKALGRWSLLPAPKAALKLALGGFSLELLASRRVLPTAALAAGLSFEHPHLSDALRDLLAPTP